MQKVFNVMLAAFVLFTVMPHGWMDDENVTKIVTGADTDSPTFTFIWKENGIQTGISVSWPSGNVTELKSNGFPGGLYA